MICGNNVSSLFCDRLSYSRMLRGNVKSQISLIACALCSLLSARPVAAYSIQTSFTHGCHEEITAQALRAARLALPDIAPPLASTGDDNALMDDTPFTIPSDLREIGAVTLILGVRDNDVMGFSALAIDQLAALNSDPKSQKLHCLRKPEHDEPTGSQEALKDCHAYIKETLLSALDGLDDQGHPDPRRREALTVTLALRGKIDVQVPIFYLRAGRALHALEDSFTHTFRRLDDPSRVTVVLNWVDFANKSLTESRDGPAHMAELDRCDDPDDFRKVRRRLAVEAGTRAISLLLEPGLDREARARSIDELLGTYLAFDAEAQCSAENRWCDAPELAYASEGCGCRMPSSGTAQPAPLAMVVGASLLGFARRRRRRSSTRPGLGGSRRTSRARAALSAAGGWLFFALSPGVARAEEARAKTGDPPAAAPSTAVGIAAPFAALRGESKAGTPGAQDRPGAFFGRVSLGASYDETAFAGGLGVRYQISKPYMIGFDLEANPWVALSPTRIRAGSINSYVSIIRRFQLQSETLNIRSQIGAGVSMLLIDLVGAPAYSFGPFFGLSFLGVEWKAAPGFYLTIDPTYIAIPIPHVTGVPFAYVQYRFLVGLEFGG